MGTSEVILVGVDGSKESFAAVKWAAERSKVRSCRLHIICTYAVASYAAATLDGGYAVLDDAALKEGASQIVKQGVDLAKEVGAPAGILIDMSREVDLIVVGSRGGGGFADRLLGTVSSALPAHAHCPVVIVPRHTSGKAFTPIERIVVGSDGSEGATSALKRAVDEAELWDARLTAVAAVPMTTGTTMMAWLPANIDRDKLLKDVKEGLDSAVDAALDGRQRKVARHALDGSPSSLLIEFSTAVDLVVVGTRGRGGFAGILLGSTSQTVIAHSTCPVMVVPSAHHDVLPDPSQEWSRR